MHTRRDAIATVAGGAVVAVAGCSALFGDGIEKSASPAAVTEGTLQTTGYEQRGMTEQQFTQTVRVSGEERDLDLTNWITEYQKLPGSTEQSAATFLIFTTPTVTIAGQSANPFDQFDERRLLRQLISLSARGDAGSLDEQGGRTFDILGTSVDTSIYQTTQSVAGQAVDVLIHTGNLTNEGDILYVMGAHPQFIDEAENIQLLSEGIDHPVEP